MRGRHRTNFLEGSVKERQFERQANKALKLRDLNLFVFNRLRGNPQKYWVFAPILHSAEIGGLVEILHVYWPVRQAQLNHFHSLAAVENFVREELFHHNANQREAQSAENCQQHDRAGADERTHNVNRHAEFRCFKLSFVRRDVMTEINLSQQSVWKYAGTRSKCQSDQVSFP